MEIARQVHRPDTSPSTTQTTIQTELRNQEHSEYRSNKQPTSNQDTTDTTRGHQTQTSHEAIKRKQQKEQESNLIKNILQSFLRKSRTFNVFDCTQFPGQAFSLFEGYWSLAGFGEFFDDVWVVS